MTDRSPLLTRRGLLRGLGTVACSAAAHPLMTTLTLAGSDGAQPLGDHRLVVVILRGAMDGLDLVRPMGDPFLSRYRPSLAAEPGLDLDGYFAMSPVLTGLPDLWRKGQLGFVHAVSTPYRNDRSHFDGQDILEAGTGLDLPDYAIRDGWLNRMLQAVPGLRAETAFAIGTEAIPLLEGRAEVRNWTPGLTFDLPSQSQRLLDHIYHDDPLFRAATTEALALGASAEAARMMAGETPPVAANRPLADMDRLVDFAADRMREATRIAAFSLSGWDTHRNQRGAINRPMRQLERIVLRLNDRLGPDVWDKTRLLAMTEFGRTVRENGANGTDHGTGGAMLMAGGALKGGRVMGGWPGLAEADLYQGRDLMPTSDVRAWAAWAMRGIYGLDRGVLEASIFPGLQMGHDPGLLA